jgi:hypothetical protein
MEEKWQRLYDELRLAISQTLRENPLTVDHAETGYRIAMEFWVKLRGLVHQSGFRDEQEEIAFFSAVKPKFTGLCEFFQLLYQYRLFCPPHNTKTNAFHEHELDKITRFREFHASFLSFYRNRKKDPILLQQYFLRRTFNAERRIFIPPYDAHPDYYTNGDWIVTQFIGNLRYQRFLFQEGRRDAQTS